MGQGKGAIMTGANSITVAEKQRRALELRKAGATFEMIADSLGYASPTGAAKAVKTAIHNIIKEPAEEVRDMEVARCDAMLFAIWPQVKQGNHGAIDRALRIQERRASYLGLDAPRDANLNLNLTDAVRIIGVNAEDI
jgi:hypothetical protein